MKNWAKLMTIDKNAKLMKIGEKRGKIDENS